MGVAKHNIKGSSYVGAYATANDRYVFVGRGAKPSSKEIIAAAMGAEVVELSAFGTDLVGLFMRANSNGMAVSNMVEERELAELRSRCPGMNIEVLASRLNAIGNNVLVNDRIAIINPDYDHAEAKRFADIFGVEVLRQEIGGFKTVGANNILTNRGMALNNRATDQQEAELEGRLHFEPSRTTANTGSLNIGLSAVANSSGVLVGEDTTGYELARIMDGLDIKD